MARHRLCSPEEVELGTVRRFEVGENAVALVHCAGGFRAVLDNCSHEDYRLSEGEVDSELCEIECAKHGSTFSLIDGEPQTLPATQPVRVVEVIVSDDDILVELP
jgi:3-phenylpropionate/trans-cinnamate dioxygenase ferredoxin subunit